MPTFEIKPATTYMCCLQNGAIIHITSLHITSYIYNSAQEEQYICALCDKRLKESNENPVLPYCAKYPNALAGANFLKALNQRPEYVCTCCHHMLFHKSVQQFNVKEYDMSNETVKECLSHQYVMKLYRHTSHENDDMTTHKWPQFVSDDVEHDDIYVMNEFICINCRNSLIPFITILVMRQYGGHYKVSGPPVNVPATLDQIIDILPCMPSELQLHPVQLKCKLEYKSHYMYDMICRDHIISAITWLKEYNSHYADIKLNEHWCSEIASRELSVQHDESDNCITINEDAVLNQSLKNENISKEKLNTDDNQQQCTTQIESTNVDTIDTETDEDTDLAEEQIAVNHRKELAGDPLPSVVQFENLENQIYQCAPGENNIPKYILLDNDFEVLAFPDLFPYGGGGYHSANRKVKLPIRKYFQQCLLNVDSRFAQNIEYLFCAQYITDTKQIENDATLATNYLEEEHLEGTRSQLDSYEIQQ